VVLKLLQSDIDGEVRSEGNRHGHDVSLEKRCLVSTEDLAQELTGAKNFGWEVYLG
jgi:hypothetical protein